MALSTLSIILILVYFALVLIIGYTSAKKNSKEDYLIGGRNLNLWQLAATISAGFMGGGFLVLFTGIAYENGFGALWLVFGQAIGLLLFALFGKKIKEMADDKKFYTLSDYFYNRFDKKTGILTSLLIFLFYLGFIIVQFIAGASILSGVTSLPYQFSVLIVGVVIILYVLLGGFKAIVKTDFFQYAILLFILLIIGSQMTLNTQLISTNLDLLSQGPVKSIALALFGAFFVIIAADIWQRAYAAKSIKAMRGGFTLAALLMIINGIFITLIGIAAKQGLPDIPPEAALIAGFSQLLPGSLLALGVILLFAAIMSTSDTLLFIASMSLSHDLLPKFNILKIQNEVRLTKITTTLVGLLGLIAAVFIQDIINFAFLFSAAMIVLAPIIIWLQFRNVSHNAAFFSLLATPILVVIIAFATGIQDELSIISLFISLITLLLGQTVSKIASVIKNAKKPG